MCSRPSITPDSIVASQVAHLKRGVYGWNMEGLPFEGVYDSAGAGRTPSVVEEEIFAYGRKVSRHSPGRRFGMHSYCHAARDEV